MPSTIHPKFKDHVKHYRFRGFTKTQIAQILTQKYGFPIKPNTVQQSITRHGFVKGELNAKYIR